MRKISEWGHVFVIAMFCFITACSHVDEETPRSFVSRVVTETHGLRGKISSDLLAGKRDVSISGSLSTSMTEKNLAAQIEFGWISSAGVVIVYNKDRSTLVVLEPHLDNGVVSWGIIVSPKAATPSIYASGVVAN